MEKLAIHPSTSSSPRILAIGVQTWLTIAVPVLLLITGVRVVMTPAFLQLVYSLPGFSEDSYGFTREDRLKYAPLAVEYLLNGEDIDFLSRLRLPVDRCVGVSPHSGDCAMFTVAELRHMRDVKMLTRYAYGLAAVVGILTACTTYFAVRRQALRPALRRGLTNGAMLTVSLIAAIIIAAVTSWDFFFTNFHNIFFENGTWRFAYSDTLIRLFPEQFWFEAALTIGATATLGAVLLLAATRKWAAFASRGDV